MIRRLGRGRLCSCYDCAAARAAKRHHAGTMLAGALLVAVLLGLATGALLHILSAGGR